MPYKFSPSSLSLLKECPRCFWLHFNKNITRPKSIFSSLPSGMDILLKKHFDRFMEQNELPPELEELKDVKLFSDKEKLSEWRNQLKGLQWKDEHGNILKGAIDNLLVKEKKFIVLDYKTRGFPLKEDTHTSYQDQLDIYTFLLRINNYPTEDYAYLLFYYPKEILNSGEIVFHNELVKVKVNPDNALKIFNKALDVLENAMPSPNVNCEFCKWVDHCVRLT